MKPQESNNQLVLQRLKLLLFVIVVIFVVLAARLWQLQIIQGQQFVELAERNRLRTIQLVAPRGTILDCNNKPLVENRPSFNILLYRESVKDMDATTEFIVNRLGVGEDELAGRLRRSKGEGLYRPIVIKEDVEIDDITMVEAHKRDHPELQLGPEPRRKYRYGSLAAHLLGYVGEVSEDELSRGAFQGAKTGDLVGKSGVERTYNQALMGVDGKRQVMVDSVGREVGLLEEKKSMVGGDLQLTLDLELQEKAEELLKDKVGAIAAMRPDNGEILAMASAPTFDPNNFSTRISEQDWNFLINDPNRPLQNRAIQNSYPPGSTFKLFMAVAGLQEGLVHDDTRVRCSGSAVYYNRVFLCAKHEGHGTVNLEQGISKSCNIFFYELGKKMGISKIAQYAQDLGLGEKSGIDLPGERGGLMPTPEWKQQRGSKWFAGETISVSIGQGAVSVTPLQLLRGVCAIASGGRLTTPHVVKQTKRANPDSALQDEFDRLPIDADVFRRVREGMWGSVNSWGTGHNAAIPGLDICGKTGTVQVISNEKKKEARKDPAALEDHSWFVGFGTRDKPEIAVVVFLEHGGKGGIAAAPLARELFSVFYAKKPDGGRKDAALDQISEVRR